MNPHNKMARRYHWNSENLKSFVSEPARKTYDKSISYLSSAIEGAEIEREQRIQALRKLAEYSTRMFNQE
jgi:hypothetical protein